MQGDKPGPCEFESKAVGLSSFLRQHQCHSPYQCVSTYILATPLSPSAHGHTQLCAFAQQVHALVLPISAHGASHVIPYVPNRDVCPSWHLLPRISSLGPEFAGVQGDLDSS